MDVIKVAAAARGYGLWHACAASKYRAQLTTGGKISSTIDHG
ncbi:hypothetical protein [uncultured Campylobacter sp.]|nr:hypothetical protein [uncultured Campylobacter sp.]